MAELRVCHGELPLTPARNIQLYFYGPTLQELLETLLSLDP